MTDLLTNGFVRNDAGALVVHLDGAGGGGAVALGDPNSLRTPGRYYNTQPAGQGNGTRAFGPGVATLSPWWVPKAQSFDRLGINVNIPAAAGGSCRLGILSDPGSGYPSPAAVVLDAGTVPTDGAGGFKEIVIAQTLQPGLYWLVGAPQVAAATFVVANVGGNAALPPIAVTDGSCPPGSAWYKGSVNAGPLSGTTWTGYDSNPLNGILFALRAA